MRDRIAEIIHKTCDGVYGEKGADQITSLPIEHVETCGECDKGRILVEENGYENTNHGEITGGLIEKPCPSCKEGKATWRFVWERPCEFKSCPDCVGIGSGIHPKLLSHYDLEDMEIAYAYWETKRLLNKPKVVGNDSVKLSHYISHNKGTIRAIRKEKG
jgi:hypothetical protein